MVQGARAAPARRTFGVVEAMQLVVRPALMYNLTVAEVHTFFVGEEAWLVHNTCNPYGRRGSPPHQAKITDAETRLNKSGWKTESGGSKPEKLENIPGVGKRYPDLVMKKGQDRIAIQVGKTTKTGPVARESRALNDLRKGSFKHVWFLKY